MRAIALSEFGSLDVLTLRELPRPEPGPHEVLIRVAFAGVNPADWKDREGMTAAFMGATFPYTLGFDAAGIVEAVGSEVARFAKGERVFTASDHGQGKPGSYAEFVVASDSAVAHVPDELPLDVAASIPVAGLTAWQALFDPDMGALPRKVEAQDAHRVVLINGGAGGLGSFAVQFARHAGHQVIATCGPDNLDYVTQLGAHHVVDYRAGSVAEQVLDVSPAGVDLLLDAVGVSSLPDPLAMLSPAGGTLVSVPTLTDDGDVETSIEAARQRGLRKVFAFMSDRDVSDTLTTIARLLVSGAIQPPQITTFDLADVARAHALIQGGHVRGKLVLRVA